MSKLEANNPEKKLSKTKKFQTKIAKIPASGVLLSACSGVFFVTSAVIVKFMHHYNPFELLAIRSFFQAIVFAIILKVDKKSFVPVSDERFKLFVRCTAGFLATASSYYSYRFILFGDATALFLASPVFVNILACMLIGESCQFIKVISLILTLTGVALISKPTFIFNPENLADGGKLLIGTSCALFAALSAAFSAVFMKKIKKICPSLNVFWFSSLNLVFSLIVVIFMKDFTFPYDFEEVSVLITFAFCSIIGLYLLTISYRFEDAGPISLARSFDVLLSFIIQVILFHEPIGWESILGSSLIFIGLFLIVSYRWYKQNPDIINCLIPNKTVKELCKECGKKVDKGISIISIKEFTETIGEKY